jgi:flagellar hook-associated protein 3 FlgL
MQFQSIGDLASHLSLRHHNARIADDLERLSTALGTGRVSDLTERVNGNFRPLATISHSLELLERFADNAMEAGLRAETSQSALSRVQVSSETTLSILVTFGNTGGAIELGAAIREGAIAFGDSVAALNTTSAGESLFAGIATDSAALAPAETILEELALLVAGETTAAGIYTIVTDYFTADGGGYETSAYLGDATARGAVRVGDGVTVRPDTTALDPAIRDALVPLAALALIDKTATPGTETRREIALLARDDLLSANLGLTVLRANIGASQDRIATQETANAAEISALEIARSEITDADPYDTAIELEAVTTQLELLYTLTGRLSSLNLMNFLR